MNNEVTVSTFNYGQLDSGTATFLKQRESNMRDIVGNAATELGKELHKAQQALANNRNGIFEEWYTSLGFKKNKVYDLMNRYKFIVGNSNNKDLLEELPLTLTYEIAKPSANEELKQKVLDGEVKSLKEYRELEKKLKQIEEEKSQLSSELEKEKNKPETIEKVIDNTDYDSIQKLNKQLEQREKSYQLLMNEKQALENKMKLTEKENEEYQKFKWQLESISRDKNNLHRQIESATSISGLYVEIEHMLQNKLAPIKYSRALTERRDSEVVIENLQGIINMVRDWADDMETYLPNKKRYINAEVIEYED